MNEKGFIYGLRCPLSGNIKYVGQTIKKLNRRLTEHKCDKRHNTYKVNWINKLHRLNILDDLKIELLEECEKEILNEKEIYWIKKVKNDGYKLVNLTNGGDSGEGRVCSDETKRKLSIANKGKKLSDKTKKRISDKKKGQKLTKEHKKSISLGLKSSYDKKERKNIITNEQKQKISKGLKKYFLENPKTKRKRKKERHIYTKEEKLEKSKKISGKNNPFYGKSHNEKTKKIIGEKNREHMLGEKNHFYGKKHNNKSKEKISNTLKNKPKKIYYIYDDDIFIKSDTSINLLSFFNLKRKESISRFCDKNKKFKGFYIKSKLI